MSKEIPEDVAVETLRRLFKKFSGATLPKDKAKELLEDTRKELAA